MGRIDSRLSELGLELPSASAPAANYVPFTVSGNLVFVAGQLTFWNGKLQVVGKVGAGVSLEDAYRAARLCGLNLLAHLKVACGGDLDRVRRVVRVEGFVNCPPDFTDHPKVVNGASDLMVEVFGEAGKHARFAVGAGSIPLGSAVEVAAIFEIA